MRRRNRPILAGLVVSVAVHVGVLLPLLVLAMGAATPHGAVHARFEPDQFRPDPPPPEDRVALGIERETAARLTWIGHEEYEEHLARLSETEQAQFTEAPGEANAPLDGGPAAQPAPEPAPASPARPGEPAPDRRPPAEPREQPPDPQPLPERPDARPLAAAPEDVTPMGPPAPPAEPAPEPPEPAPPAAADPSAGDRPGDPSDRESDATSPVEVPLDEIKVGRPLAAHGLELKPQRPHFTTLMKLTASPGNPLVEIRFKGDGRPLEALILQSSGNAPVDHAIRNSLYRWRARGERLEGLEGDDTVNIRLRIVLR